MKFLKNLLGISKLENQISKNQSQIKNLKSQIKTQTTKSKTQSSKNSSQIKTQKTSLQKFKTLFIKTNQIEIYKTKALKILTTPKSTAQVAKSLNIGRSYTSRILNQLEKQGKIIEYSKKNKTILYKKL